MMGAGGRIIAALCACLVLAACEEPAPPPEPKDLSRSLRQDVRAGKANIYEQYSRCGGAYKLFSATVQSNNPRLTPEGREALIGMTQRSALFQGFATGALGEAAGANRPSQSQLQRQATRNVDAYAGSYALILAAQAVQSGGRTDRFRPLIESDIRFCETLLKDKFEQLEELLRAARS